MQPSKKKFDKLNQQPLRRRNCKLRQFLNRGLKITCARFSKKLTQNPLNQNQHEYFVTGDDHNNIRFYQFLGQQQLQCYNTNINANIQSEISAVSISWNQLNIFSGSARGIINVWDILQTKTTPACTLKGHTTAVNCFGLFPGQKDQRIASGSYDTSIKLWDIRQKDNYAILKQHTKQINSIDISPDSNFLLSGSQDCTIKFWDLRFYGKVLNTYNQHTAPVIKTIFNPQDFKFASCSSDKTVKYFTCDQQQTKYHYISTTDIATMPITSIDFNLNGSLLCLAGNNILRICDMKKNGLLIQSLDSSWKNVQDIIWCSKGIKGLASSGEDISVWFCYLGEKKGESNCKLQEQQIGQYKLLKTPSQREKSISFEDKKIIKPFSIDKQFQQNSMITQRITGVDDVSPNKNKSIQNHPNSEQTKPKDHPQKPLESKLQIEFRIKQKQLIKQQQRKQKIRLTIQKQRKQKQIKQKQKSQKIQKKKQHDSKVKQQQLQLQKFKNFNQYLLQQKFCSPIHNPNDINFQASLQHDILQNPQAMDLSTFVGNHNQKQKLLQLQAIQQLMKSKSRFESVIKMKSSYIRPIIHYWKQGKLDSAMCTLSQADITVANDCISAIIQNSTFKLGITPDIACQFITKLIQIMNNKYSTYVKNAMNYLNIITLMFKDQLIQIKTLYPSTKINLSQQEKIIQYDRLIEQFLNVFNQSRLKKYASTNNVSDNQQIHQIAYELYKNLQQILKKIIPKKQPEVQI